MTAGVAPEPGAPILPRQLERRVQREARALADAMFAAAGDPLRMRAALQSAIDRTGVAAFGPTCSVALQHLSTMIATVMPGATVPNHHYTEETR